MTTRRIGLIAFGAAVAAIVVAFFIERDRKGVTAERYKTEVRDKPKSLPDTLRAVTLYGPTSYFSYRDETMGMDYEMVTGFAKELGIPLKLEIASSIPEMLKMLKNGEVDLIAYDVPRIAEYRKNLLFCGKDNVNHQVLVQPSKKPLKDVTELIGKTIYVEKDSKYQFRLANLNQELGGGIGIEAVVSDTLETADLVKMVSDGDLPYTVTDSDMAAICSEAYGNIDVSMAVGLDQYSSWAVSLSDSLLAVKLNEWVSTTDMKEKYANIQKKYFEHLIIKDEITDVEAPYSESDATLPAKGSISRYDHLFKKYAGDIGWDWRQLAAIGYTESKFNPSIVSWAGARGLMQLMPSTAKTYGVASRMNDPDASVYAASRLLADLDKSLRSKVRDPEERRKFVIASYNSGLGHILDAIALAQKYGRNPEVWYGNVREMALLKTKPKYYNDPVVKHGYFRGQETVNFVDRVMSAYRRYSGAQ